MNVALHGHVRGRDVNHTIRDNFEQLMFGNEKEADT